MTPYYFRWVQEVEVFLCLEEIGVLQMSMKYAFEHLYREDKELESPSFDNLHKGYLLLQLSNKLIKLPQQKRFQVYPYNHQIKVKFPLALLSCLYDVVASSRMGSLIRLQGNIETVLQGFGYEFVDEEPVSYLEALKEEYYRLESDLQEFREAH
ncbi:hypothetical protein [Siphonobacter sp.]|uniref:hypothetical protein n=1 Tax=Siphonobacter sp. TaxID=1869184 RepID=UPI003B3A32D2